MTHIGSCIWARHTQLTCGLERWHNLQGSEPCWRKYIIRGGGWFQGLMASLHFLFILTLLPGYGWSCDQPASCHWCHAMPSLSERLCLSRNISWDETSLLEGSLFIALGQCIFITETESNTACATQAMLPWIKPPHSVEIHIGVIDVAFSVFICRGLTACLTNLPKKSHLLCTPQERCFPGMFGYRALSSIMSLCPISTMIAEIPKKTMAS